MCIKNLYLTNLIGVTNSILTRGLRCLYFVRDGKDSLNTLPVKSTIQKSSYVVKYRDIEIK